MNVGSEPLAKRGLMKPMRKHSILVFLAVCLSAPLAGCVMTEKYDAEKARALNFQRLLAQEEKRTGDMDADLKRLKRENTEFEARNRELTAQLQAVREQFARLQEETHALREAAALRDQQDRPQAGRAKRSDKPTPGGRPVPENNARSANPSPGMGGASASAPAAPMDLKAAQGTPLYHEVKPGETLFRIARQYGVNVETIKHWNHLPDDVIEVGQKLVVGHQ
jgi:LysM repeat protein